MVKHKVKVVVPEARATDFYDFMINPTDEKYSAWWPGEHLQFHIVKRGKACHTGDIVFMDEYLGKNRRLTFHGKVIKAKKPKQIVWQMQKFGIGLPAYVKLTLKDTPYGLKVKHETKIGYDGLGKLLDPIIKLYFNKSFQKALEKHCLIEWPKLGRYLKNE
ncbi:MAG: hypothetical protein FWC67_02740 [Defluviitaleaceae bacterium]|nr:hypothetical protein [Defluviitaleaceae bacterium]